MRRAAATDRTVSWEPPDASKRLFLHAPRPPSLLHEHAIKFAFAGRVPGRVGSSGAAAADRERHISGATVTGRPTIDDDDDARTGSNATRCDLISNAERVCGSIRAVDRVGG